MQSNNWYEFFFFFFKQRAFSSHPAVVAFLFCLAHFHRKLLYSPLLLPLLFFSHSCLFALAHIRQVRSDYCVLSSALSECEEQVSISLPLCSHASLRSSVSASFGFCSVFFTPVCLTCKRIKLALVVTGNNPQSS